MTTTLPIRHHYLPVFYLDRWTGDDGRLFRYYRPYREVVVSPISPSNTGFETELYSLEDVAPEQRQVIETQFMAAAIDSPAAVVLEKILAGGLPSLTDDERVIFTLFTMSLEHRGPQALKEMAVLGGDIVRQELEADDQEYQAIRKAGDPDTLYDWALKNAPQYLANIHKRFLPGIINNHKVGQHVVNMLWAVVDVSGSQHALLTSDRPLIRDLGLRDPEAIWTLPLSPIHLFVGVNSEKTLHVIAAQRPDDIVRFVNDALMRNAVNNVYGNSPDHLASVEQSLRRSDDPIAPGIAGRLLKQQG